MSNQRTALKQLGKEERHSFVGTFVRNGGKNGFKGPVTTLLLSDIYTADGEFMTDHLWFNETKGFKDAHLKEGDKVAFDARVSKYTKGYMGRRDFFYDDEAFFKPIEVDYKLSRPTKVKNLSQDS